ncbi:glycosyltransferase family protein [Gammaproteobacteria bacterium]|nr:glycosyltransferase family protein [Gammaproteobacteria bacterium]
MKFIATIEARMTSSRLPGKPLMKAGSKTMLEHLVMRLRRVKSIDNIVLATTVNNEDDDLVDEAERLGINYFRGSEDDVLNRVIGAASSVDADVIIEITGDCPIIDPGIIEQTIQMYKAHNVDYVSNVMVRSYPDGMDVQVFSLETLIKSASMTNDPLDIEHVSLHIRNNPELFTRVHLVAPPELHWPELGLTLDEKKDFDLISAVIEHFGDSSYLFSCQEAINLLKENPQLTKINKTVSRKGNT